MGEWILNVLKLDNWCLLLICIDRLLMNVDKKNTYIYMYIYIYLFIIFIGLLNSSKDIQIICLILFNFYNFVCLILFWRILSLMVWF